MLGGVTKTRSLLVFSVTANVGFVEGTMGTTPANVEYRWKRIEPLTEQEKKIDLSDIVPLSESWKQFKARLKDSNPAGLRQFNERLVRSLSIETGILERIYDLDRGTTEALIAKGFIEELNSAREYQHRAIYFGGHTSRPRSCDLPCAGSGR
jgi:hypothetical protein